MTLLCLHACGNFVFMHYIIVCSCMKKIKANSQRPHLLNLWVQHPMHLSAPHFFPVSILSTWQPCACIVMDMASDSTWAAWIECQRENLNCSATELLWISTAKPSSTQKNVFLGQKPDEYVEPRNMLFKTDGRMQSESWTMDKKRDRALCAF